MNMANNFQLERDAFGRLVMIDAAGRRHEGVAPVRAFPIAAPEEGLSLVGSDGHELAWIDALASLPPGQRALIDEELASREFVPEIKRLKAVSTFSTPSIWTVDTDRGETEFVLKTEEDIRRLKNRNSLLITGGEGVHFMVRDVAAMDRASKRLLERFL
ncbi:hypothetical protein RD110_06540 [Rhodoferax koreense]|uniref:DUF1854 domain-containing protein n=1 Tax=Rhodoferax koreensis TaxID=1842727 RepID=A0A1P8JT01_9BURK|nr:DUF1854 domain-containing protein [Rhodoferax koreense]APW36892.1 hypothetical protein RD110_06540 [Rhodoferax koreense]